MDAELLTYQPGFPYYILYEAKQVGPVTFPVGMFVQTTGPIEGGLLCDGSEYDPERYPELDLVLKQPGVAYRHRFWRWRWGRYETTYPFGVHRLPDCMGRKV